MKNYIPNLVNCIEPVRRSPDEFDDKLDVEGDGRRLSVLAKKKINTLTND